MAAKLSPERTQLSDLQARERAEPERLPTVPVAPVSPFRRCASCGAADIITRTDHREPDDAPQLHHSVTIDVRFLGKLEECTAKKRAQGWIPRTLQGRPAMERFVCRACLIGQREMQREYRRKLANEKSAGIVGDPYWLAVCGE